MKIKDKQNDLRKEVDAFYEAIEYNSFNNIELALFKFSSQIEATYF